MSIPPTHLVPGPAIQVQRLAKSYRDLCVPRGVDFEVTRGSIFALLGANGAGKTTVVKILSTLLTADTGTARVNGFDVATRAADVRESIGLTGQFAAVDEIPSGRENPCQPPGPAPGRSGRAAGAQRGRTGTAGCSPHTSATTPCPWPASRT